jgi:hypothetical protein
MDLVSEEEVEATTAWVSEMQVTCECFSGGGGRTSRTGCFWVSTGSGRRQGVLGFDRQEDGSGTGGSQWQ